MARVNLALLLLPVVLLASSCQRPSALGPEPPISPAAGAFNAGWALAPLWDDGQAEVALYTARRPQYGKLRDFETVLIVVKEDFNPAFYAKAEAPYQGRSLLPVIKLNFVQSYWTENYPYQFLTSVFVRRDDPTALVKLTQSSQEWCGNTFKEIRGWTRPSEFVFHSYWDEEGDGTRPLELRPGDLLEDQLLVSLRGLRFSPGLEVRTRLLPSLISNKLGAALRFVEATIRVADRETLTTARGRVPAWKVSVQAGELSQTYWFAEEAPHTLLKMVSSDGRELWLKEVRRAPYWQAATYRPEDGRLRAAK